MRGLSALDKQLENVKVLPVLQVQAPEAPDVIDPDTGEVKGECRQVRLHACRLPPSAMTARASHCLRRAVDC